MSSIGQYGFINAKVRAMRSFILAESVLHSMAAADSLQDILTILSQTRFKNLVEKIHHQEQSEIELLLLGEEIKPLQIIRKYSKGVVQTLISLLIETYDIEKLKVILRRWYRPMGMEPDIFREKILYDFPIDAMLAAESFEEFVHFLAETPFRTVLSGSRKEYESSHTLFSVELALDRDWVSRLWQYTESLNTKDRLITRKLLGLEIDLKNLNWIERYRTYYGMHATDISHRILPFGYHFGEADIQRILTQENILAATDGLIDGTGLNIPKKEVPSFHLETLENSLYHLLVREAHRAFQGFPFSIGSIIGFYILNRIEMKNIRTLLHTKWYGLPAEQAEALLIL